MEISLLGQHDPYRAKLSNIQHGNLTALIFTFEWFTCLTLLALLSFIENHLLSFSEKQTKKTKNKPKPGVSSNLLTQFDVSSVYRWCSFRQKEFFCFDFFLLLTSPLSRKLFDAHVNWVAQDYVPVHKLSVQHVFEMYNWILRGYNFSFCVSFVDRSETFP